MSGIADVFSQAITGPNGEPVNVSPEMQLNSAMQPRPGQLIPMAPMDLPFRERIMRYGRQSPNIEYAPQPQLTIEDIIQLEQGRR